MSALPVIGGGANQWAKREVKLAMALTGKRRHYQVHAILRRRFNSTAKKVGYGDIAEPLLRELIERTRGAIAQVAVELPQGFSQVVADKVPGGLQTSAFALEAKPAT